MRVWHVTKTESSLNAIKQSMEISLGRNVHSPVGLAHVTTVPFRAGNWALDVIGPDTNEAWVLELEISESTPLATDPADNGGEIYGGGWMVGKEPIKILKIISVKYIENVQDWESK